MQLFCNVKLHTKMVDPTFSDRYSLHSGERMFMSDEHKASDFRRVCQRAVCLPTAENKTDKMFP